MSEKKPKTYIAQLTEKDGKFGKFMSGSLGMTWITVSPAKAPGKWNVYLEQKDLEQTNPVEKVGSKSSPLITPKTPNFDDDVGF